MTDMQWRAEDFDAQLDACGLNCPLPLLKAKLELNRLARCSRLRPLMPARSGISVPSPAWPGIVCCVKRSIVVCIAIGCARPSSCDDKCGS